MAAKPIHSPWCEIDERLLYEASTVLNLVGDDVTMWTEGEYLRFARYDDVWCVVAEGVGTPSCHGGFIGSCMSAQRAEPILRRLIASQRPRQLDLFA